MTLETEVALRLDNKAIVVTALSEDQSPEDGSPALLIYGWHSAEVADLALIQGKDATHFGGTGHLGAFVVGSDSKEPWRIEAYDRSGTLVGTYEGPPRRPILIGTVGPSDTEQRLIGDARVQIVSLKRFDTMTEVEWRLAVDPPPIRSNDKREAGHGTVSLKDLPPVLHSAFINRLALTGDVGTIYEHKGGGGSFPDGAAAHWQTSFEPAIPAEASSATVHYDEQEFEVLLT